jgi:hypothetical protein
MASKRKAQQEETIEISHGINPRTFEIESDYLGRDGVLRKFGPNAEKWGQIKILQ